MISEKDKLAAKTVEQLKAAAKRLGGKLVTPDGKAKTKQQLINTIVMKKRLAGVGMGAKQTGTSNKAKDLQRKAKAPGKRTSAKGKAYTETRKNRSDKPPGLLGEKPYNELPDLRVFTVNVLSATNTMGTRIKIVDTQTLQSKTIPKNYSVGAMNQAKDYLNSLGIKIFAKSADALLSKNFDIRLKS
jgi:hypothetical protein